MLIDAALTPAEIALLPQRDLGTTACVVFDVLRATSSMITALAHGTREIHPVASIEEARALKLQLPDAVLGGERHGDLIEGFDVGNNPLDYKSYEGRRIITTTTNGTIALKNCSGAGATFAAALLNLAAVHAAIRERQPEKLLLVCAGTFETFALEDAFAAGMLATMFPQAQLTDAALTLTSLTRAFPSALNALLSARNGLALAKRGWVEQVEFCAKVSCFDVVGLMTDGIVRPLQP